MGNVPISKLHKKLRSRKNEEEKELAMHVKVRNAHLNSPSFDEESLQSAVNANFYYGPKLRKSESRSLLDSNNYNTSRCGSRNLKVDAANYMEGRSISKSAKVRPATINRLNGPYFENWLGQRDPEFKSSAMKLNDEANSTTYHSGGAGVAAAPSGYREKAAEKKSRDKKAKKEKKHRHKHQKRHKKHRHRKHRRGDSSSSSSSSSFSLSSSYTDGTSLLGAISMISINTESVSTAPFKRVTAPIKRTIPTINRNMAPFARNAGPINSTLPPDVIMGFSTNKDGRFVFTSFAKYDNFDDWDALLRKTAGTMTGLRRQFQVSIKFGDKILTYQGERVRLLQITGRQKGLVIRCKANLPLILRDRLVMPADDVKEIDEYAKERPFVRLSQSKQNLSGNMCKNATKSMTSILIKD